jgi:type II secretory pathway pseudopilin PulG
MPFTKIRRVRLRAESSTSRGFTLRHLLVAIAVLGLLAAIFVPAIRSARPYALALHCRNNLDQIGRALEQYHDDYGRFPPAYTVDADGRPLHSWRTLLLPYLEEQELYDRIDLSKPWDDPANRRVYPDFIRAYRCVGKPEITANTAYLAIVAPGSAIRPVESCSMREITDGLNNTLLIIEADASCAVPWMTPQDVDERQLLEIGPTSKLQHQGGWHALLADGIVRKLHPKLSPDTRRKLISIAGHETPDSLEPMPPPNK